MFQLPALLWKQRFGAHLMAGHWDEGSGHLAACPKGGGQEGATGSPLAQLSSTHNHWNLSLLGWAVLLSTCGGGCVERWASPETGNAWDRLWISPFLRFTGKWRDKARKTLWNEMVIRAFLLAEMWQASQRNILFSCCYCKGEESCGLSYPEEEASWPWSYPAHTLWQESVGCNNGCL